MGGLNEKNRYEVINVYWGGFGIVYKVIDRFWKKIFAIKTFQDKFFKTEKVVRDFYGEAEMWISLGFHNNIVEAKYVIEIDYKPHLIMEYVDGGSLRELLRKKKLTAKEIFNFANQFCTGMTYVSSMNPSEEITIVHRDIKPENIMLTRDGVLKITDFGLAKALSTPALERPAGTPEYMAPEQFRTMDVDTRADIYSFGVVLYEMLTGRPPFWTEDEGKRWNFCRKHHQQTDPILPRLINSSIPITLEKVVLKCLEKKPKDRYQSFKDLRTTLGNVYFRIFGQHLAVQTGSSL